MVSENMKSGIFYALAAYILWGVLPIYWKFLANVEAMEVLAHRIIWSFIFMVVLLIFTKQFRPFLQVCREMVGKPKNFIGMLLASLLISSNWLVFIWAVANDFVLQASLGYYINPLASIFLGIFVLGEKLSTRQIIAFILCVIGVAYLTFSAGVFPWISLVLAVTFALYGLLKKKIDISSAHGLTFETMLVLPIAAGYLFLLPNQAFSFSVIPSMTDLLLIGTGFATAIPLLLFAKGAKTIPLSLVGILQFINPTMIFFISIFIFKEPFSKEKFIAFLFIWSALFLYLSTVYYHPVKKRANY